MADQAGGILPDIERNEETRPLLAELARLIRDRKRSPLAPPLARPWAEAQSWLEGMGDFYDLTRPEQGQEAEMALMHHAAKLVERMGYLSCLDLLYDPDDPEADRMRGEAMRLVSELKKSYPEALGLKRGAVADPMKAACLQAWASLPEAERKAYAAKKNFAQAWINQTRTRTNERTITNWIAQWEKERLD